MMRNLRFGDRGDDVRTLQRWLTEAGYPVTVDGFFGNTRTGDDETGDALERFQRGRGLKPDRIAGPLTRAEFAKALPGRVLEISDAALQLILDYEVGGGEAYYNRFLARPTWPGGESGVTIGVGFDLGYEPTMAPWRGVLPAQAIASLSQVMGLRGSGARRAVEAGTAGDVTIPWDAALQVFMAYTLPSEIAKTLLVYPGAERLGGDVLGALVSLVYNRGASLSGSTRREMAAIVDLVRRGDVSGIAQEILKMKRLWPDVRGLLMRRDAEAALILSAVP